MQWWYKNELSLYESQPPGCKLSPQPPSCRWRRDTVPYRKVLSAPGHGGRWQNSWQAVELRETLGQRWTHARWWCSTSAAEIWPRVLKPSEQRQGFKGDFIASYGCCLWVFVFYPCTMGRVGGNAHMNSGVWGSTAPPCQQASSPSPMGVRNFLKIALRRRRMLTPKCVGVTESKK